MLRTAASPEFLRDSRSRRKLVIDRGDSVCLLVFNGSRRVLRGDSPMRVLADLMGKDGLIAISFDLHRGRFLLF